MELEASPLIQAYVILKTIFALVAKTVQQRPTYLSLFFAKLSSCLLVYWLFIRPGTVAVISNVHSGEGRIRLYQEWSNAQQEYEFVKIIETSMNGAAETAVDER